MAYTYKTIYRAAEKLTELAQQETDPDLAESFYRLAVSRYYYSLFLCARKLATTKMGLSAQNAKDHGKVWETVSKDLGLSIRRDFLNCYKYRCAADYGDLINEVEKMTRDTKTIVDRLNPLFEHKYKRLSNGQSMTP